MVNSKHHALESFRDREWRADAFGARRRRAMLDRFPAIEPYESGMLDVGDGHRVY